MPVVFPSQLAPQLSIVDSYVKNLQLQEPVKREARTVTNTVILNKSEYVTGDTSFTVDIEDLFSICKINFLLSTTPLEAVSTDIPIIRLNRKYQYLNWSMTDSDYSPTQLPTDLYCKFYVKSDWIWFSPVPDRMPRSFWDVTITLFNDFIYYQDIYKDKAYKHIGTESGPTISSILNTSIDSLANNLPVSKRDLTFDNIGNNNMSIVYNTEGNGSYTVHEPIQFPIYYKDKGG